MTKAKTKTKAEATKTAFVLRCCREDLSSQNGFVWPDVGGEAICPDWINNNECGNGLHGWLYGQGGYSTSSYWNDPAAKWLVVEVEESGIVILGSKCKFERGFVRFIGDKTAAAAYLIDHEPRAKDVAVIGASLVVGDEQAVIVGALGTATAGYRGTATAGDRGTATAGDSGTATAGTLGTATAGDSGELRIRYWDTKAERYRTVIAYVGEDGIDANVPYRLDDQHKLVKA